MGIENSHYPENLEQNQTKLNTNQDIKPFQRPNFKDIQQKEAQEQENPDDILLNA